MSFKSLSLTGCPLRLEWLGGWLCLPILSILVETSGFWKNRPGWIGNINLEVFWKFQDSSAEVLYLFDGTALLDIADMHVHATNADVNTIDYLQLYVVAWLVRVYACLVLWIGRNSCVCILDIICKDIYIPPVFLSLITVDTWVHILLCRQNCMIFQRIVQHASNHSG